MSLLRHRDTYAGALMALIGAFAIIEAQEYGIGTLTNMGSGFFPAALGTGLIGLGVLMAVFRSSAPGHGTTAPDWRGAAAIAIAVMLFMLLARPAGLAPATFAAVFAGALGTRRTTLREAALLAAGVTVFGTLLFALGLKVPFPIINGVLQ